MMRLSDRRLKRLPREADGSLSDDTVKKYIFDTDAYDGLPNVREDVLEYINNAGSLEVKRDRLAEVQVYLENALLNGGGEMDDLGIRVTRLNVLDTVPVGTLATEVDLVARRRVERRAQEERRAAAIETAMAYVRASIEANPSAPMSFENALRAARVDLGEAEEIQTSGSGRTIAFAGARGR